MSIIQYGFQPVPETSGDEIAHRQQLARALNNVIGGKVNATVDVTLTPSATSTILNDARILGTSAIVPAMAMTAAAATAMAAGIYVDTVVSQTSFQAGSAVIHHASNAAVNQTIRFLIIG